MKELIYVHFFWKFVYSFVVCGANSFADFRFLVSGRQPSEIMIE